MACHELIPTWIGAAASRITSSDAEDQVWTPQDSLIVRSRTGSVMSDGENDATRAKVPEGLIRIKRYIRLFNIVLFTITSCLSIWSTQVIGYPLKFISPNLYRAYIDITKQSFGIFLTTLYQFWTPADITITGDKEFEKLFSLNVDGTLKTDFGDRVVLISNHQLYSDWAYIWWIAFTAKMHGAIYIILKASLKKVPVIGWGMQAYRFIFLSRKWQVDQKVLTEGLETINRETDWPAWLLLFPEGTTLSRNGYAKSLAYAKKSDTKPLKHLLLPRATGLRYSIAALSSSVEYVYDATIHYTGLPKNVYGEDYFTLRAIYLEERFPKKIEIYWRRYRIADIPYQDEDKFAQWIQDLWTEKDQLLERKNTEGSFVIDEENSATMKPVTVPIKLNSPFQAFQMYSVPLNVVLIGSLIRNHLGNALSIFGRSRAHS